MSIYIKPITHETQQGNGVLNDCGPCDVLILARAMGKAAGVTLKQLSAIVDRGQDGTSSPDLVKAFAHLGIQAQIGVDTYPRIKIVAYGYLPFDLKAPGYRAGDFPHWVVQTAPDAYLDTLHTNAKTGTIEMTPAQQAQFERAHQVQFARSTAAGYDVRSVAPIGAGAPPAGSNTVTQTNGKAVITYGSWNVRATADVAKGVPAGAVLGVLERGQEPVVLREVAMGGLTFAEIDLRAGGVELRAGGTIAGKAKTGFIVKRPEGWRYVETVPQTPPQPAPNPPASTVRLGEPLLGVHVRGKHHLADAAMAGGCRYVILMHGKTKAVQLAQAYPDALVVYRPWLDRGYLPSVEQTMMALEIDGNEPSNLAVQFTNESDSIGTSVAEIRRYADYMRKCIAEMRRRGSKAKVMVPSWGHGNPPEIESNPEVQRAVREEFAPLYNSGQIMFDLHNYSAGRVVDVPADDIWYVRRFVWFFTHCGFDPRVKNFWSSEAGVEAGSGGFQWAGYTDEELYRWCASSLRVLAMPITVGGVEFESPFRGQALFCLNDETENKQGNWFGYTIWQRQIPVLAKFWFDVKDGAAKVRGFIDRWK